MAQAGPAAGAPAKPKPRGYVLESELLMRGRADIGDQASWFASSAKPGNGVELLRDGSSDTFWQSDGLAPHTITLQWPRRMVVSEIALQLDYPRDESYTPQTVCVRSGAALGALAEVTRVELPDAAGWVRIPLRGTASAAAAAAAATGGAATAAKAEELRLQQLWRRQGLTALSPAYGSAADGAARGSAAASAPDLLLRAIPPPREVGGGSGDGEDAEDDSADAGMTLLSCHVLQLVLLTMFLNGRDAHVRQVRVLAPAAAAASPSFGAAGSESVVTTAHAGSEPLADAAAAASAAATRRRRKHSAEMLQFAGPR